MRSLLAYVASAAIGAAIILLPSGIRFAHYDYILFGLLALSTIIGLCFLPFWVAVISLIRRYKVDNPLLYGLSATIIGNLIGPTFGAALPKMMWDRGPQLSYAGQWAKIFNSNFVIFSTAGLTAGLTYGFVVCWPLHAQNRQP